MAQSSGDGAMGIMCAAFNAKAESGELYEPPGSGMGGMPTLRAAAALESNEDIGDLLL